jgi:hypothetical protein
VTGEHYVILIGELLTEVVTDVELQSALVQALRASPTGTAVVMRNEVAQNAVNRALARSLTAHLLMEQNRHPSS